MQDPDDVPSATLALAIGALFLTEDKAAYEAVHGARVDTAQLRRWLDPLRDGGDAAELQQMFSLTLAAPVVGIAGAWNAARWLRSRSQLAFISAAGFAAGVMLFSQAESYQKAWAFSKDVVSRIGDGIVMPQRQATDRIRSALPQFPEWDDLVQGAGRDAALTRACLYRLCRSRKAHIRAAELSNQLPMLGIGQGASRVGKMSGGNPASFNPTRNSGKSDDRSNDSLYPRFALAQWSRTMTLAELRKRFPVFVEALVARDAGLLDIELNVTLEHYLQTDVESVPWRLSALQRRTPSWPRNHLGPTRPNSDIRFSSSPERGEV